MNLPNKLTMFRILIIPILVVLLVIEEGRPWTYMGALALFALATITDIADGRIARSRNLITDFGKLMDPLADKVMISCVLICFVELEVIPAWIAIVVVFREFMISGFRLIAAEKGVVIAANKWGKHKTAFQTVFIIAMLVAMSSDAGLVWEGFYTSVSISPDWVMYFFSFMINFNNWMMIFFTIFSLAVYMKQNWSVMGEDF